MFGNIQIPDALAPHELDLYLEDGWFRMGQTIFTCNFLHFNNTFYSAIWLRHELSRYKEDQSFTKLKKLNHRFSVVYRTANVDVNKEELYQTYKTGIAFETANSLRDLMFGESENNIYNTQEIAIYDEQKLIAIGYYDLGENAAMGIVSFYHPAYKKHSLGRYLIYLKIEHCHKLELKYFYPGYFAPSYPMFDYKLQIGKSLLTFLDVKKDEWKPINLFGEENILVSVMENKIKEIYKKLNQAEISCYFKKYEFYNANYTPQFRGYQFFDYPFFLIVELKGEQGFAPLLVYDVLSDNYKLLKCIGFPCKTDLPVDYTYYRAALLKVQEELLVTPNIDYLLNRIIDLTQRVK